jgi:hypothetical protein
MDQDILTFLCNKETNLQREELKLKFNCQPAKDKIGIHLATARHSTGSK